MKRIVAVILISLLVAPPAGAGEQVGKPLTWEETQRLKAGTEIMLAVADGPPTKVKLLFADDSILVTLKPDAPKLAGDVERALITIDRGWLAILNRGDSAGNGHVQVSHEGVFHRDQKVADLAQVIQQTTCGNVRGISEASHSRWWGWLALIGVGAAVLVALLLSDWV